MLVLATIFLVCHLVCVIDRWRADSLHVQAIRRAERDRAVDRALRAGP